MPQTQTITQPAPFEPPTEWPLGPTPSPAFIDTNNIPTPGTPLIVLPPESTDKRTGARQIWDFIDKAWHKNPITAVKTIDDAVGVIGDKILEIGKLQHIIYMSLVDEIHAYTLQLALDIQGAEWLNKHFTLRMYDVLHFQIQEQQLADEIRFAAPITQLQLDLNAALARLRVVETNLTRLETRKLGIADVTGLQENLGHINARIDLNTLAILSTIPGLIAPAITAALGPIAMTVTNLGVRLTAVETEVAECLKPMCDVMGPKTNLGKIFKWLSTLFGIGIATGLLALDEKQIEQIASRFGAVAAGDASTFLEGFAAKGESIGQAGAGVLGDLTDVGKSVIGDLGIPGF